LKYVGALGRGLAYSSRCNSGWFFHKIDIKSQALVDFMVEWRENQVEAPTNHPEHWVMYFDGSLKLERGGAGVLFISLRGEQLKYVF
jgi:hypothetical protein